MRECAREFYHKAAVGSSKKLTNNINTNSIKHYFTYSILCHGGKYQQKARTQRKQTKKDRWFSRETTLPQSSQDYTVYSYKTRQKLQDLDYLTEWVKKRRAEELNGASSWAAVWEMVVEWRPQDVCASPKQILTKLERRWSAPQLNVFILFWNSLC